MLRLARRVYVGRVAVSVVWVGVSLLRVGVCFEVGESAFSLGSGQWLGVKTEGSEQWLG